MRHFLKKFIKHDRGVALIEFAIVSPFMFLLLFGAIEVARFILITQKVEKAAYALTDIVGQYPPATFPKVPPVAGAANEISVANMNRDVFALYDRLLSPYGSTDKEMAVISSVVHQNGRNLLRWQRRSNVASLATEVTSVVTGSAPNNISRLPGQNCPVAPLNSEINASMNSFAGDTTGTGAFEGENFIVGEVFYRYQPILGFLLGITSNSNFVGPFSMQPRTISRYVILHPRNGKLLDLPPDSPVAPTEDMGKCP